MEHLAAIMMLVGCGQGTGECTELPSPVIGYETIEECRADLAAAIGHTARKGLVIKAACAEVDPGWFEEDVEVSWDLAEDGHLVVSVRNTAGDSVASEVALSGSKMTAIQQ
ncbi:hypothetical protein LXM94_12785 [Rhizobium sp. TRM95111]|uniref:hypothetical protein n=1 Tax=Rhizobium alarense TaxID=2846851 RepID=UPI001F3BD419|nr:hypothetical protein [Rhizobium alarense]MCF3640845.1 hypothetical protein [Rhizobium alarense]